MLNKNQTITFANLGDCIVDTYIHEGKRYLGGTAYNSAFFSAKAGAQSSIISAVGDDSAGNAFLANCRQFNVVTDHIQVLPGQTSRLDIDTTNKENPQYTNWQLGVLEGFTLQEPAKNFLTSVDIAKISLFWPMKSLFEQFIDLKLPNTIKIADFSGVSMYTEDLSVLQRYSHGCDVLVKSLDAEDTQGIHLVKTIAEKENKICLMLLGGNGSMVFTKEKSYSQAAKATHVVDTNGAGDCFIGTFGYWYALTQDIPLALEKATSAASEVIQHMGATGLELSEQ